MHNLKKTFLIVQVHTADMWHPVKLLTITTDYAYLHVNIMLHRTQILEFLKLFQLIF